MSRALFSTPPRVAATPSDPTSPSPSSAQEHASPSTPRNALHPSTSSTSSSSSSSSASSSLQVHPWLVSIFLQCPHGNTVKAFSRLLLTCIKALRPLYKDRYIATTVHTVVDETSSGLYEEHRGLKGDGVAGDKDGSGGGGGSGEGSRLKLKDPLKGRGEDVDAKGYMDAADEHVMYGSGSEAKNTEGDGDLNGEHTRARAVEEAYANLAEGRVVPTGPAGGQISLSLSCVARLVQKLLLLLDRIRAEDVVTKDGYRMLSSLLLQTANLGLEEKSLLVQLGAVRRLVHLMLCVNPSVTQIVHDEVFCCTDLVAILARTCYIPRHSRSPSGGTAASGQGTTGGNRGERGDSISAFMRADQEASTGSYGSSADGKKGKGGAADLPRSPFLLPEILQLPPDQLQRHLQQVQLSHQDLSAFLNRVFLEDAANISTTPTALALQHVCWSRGAHESARVLTFLADKVADCAMQTTGVDLAYRPYFRCISELLLSRALDSSFALDSVLPALLAKVPFSTHFLYPLIHPIVLLTYPLILILVLPIFTRPITPLTPPSHITLSHYPSPITPLFPRFLPPGGRAGLPPVPQRR